MFRTSSWAISTSSIKLEELIFEFCRYSEWKLSLEERGA